MIYLDYAAATPLDIDVLSAMSPYMTDKFYNPSAAYLAARAVTDDINQARSAVAHSIGARPSEIVFTAGGTEANNLAIAGIMQQYPNGNCIVSAIEHDSVLAPVSRFNSKITPVTDKGIIDLAQLEELIDEHTTLISVMYANNEIGTIQPIKQLAAIIKSVRKARMARGNTTPLLLHTDACQAGNYLDIHVSRLAVDMMTLNGGKLYGPKQSGVLYVRAGVLLHPIILGGGQERNLRSGTENVAAIIGFAKALERAQELRHEEASRVRQLQKKFIDDLRLKVPSARINGSEKFRLPNNIHITLPGQDNERLLFALDEMGIMAAAGSACSASKEEASHVLAAIGLEEADARASLRFSLGRQTTEEEIERAVEALASIIG